MQRDCKIIQLRCAKTTSSLFPSLICEQPSLSRSTLSTSQVARGKLDVVSLYYFPFFPCMQVCFSVSNWSEVQLPMRADQNLYLVD